MEDLNYEKVIKAKKIRDKLTETTTNIITPNLGKGFHLISSYYRFQFIAKVIEYMVSMKMAYGIDELDGKTILDAVCKHTKYLLFVPSEDQLKLLMLEVSIGLGLLEDEELGTIKVSNPLHLIDKSQPAEINQFLGHKFRLSSKGWESYSKQEYQILASNLFAARLGRCVSYIALLIALISLLIRCFSE